MNPPAGPIVSIYELTREWTTYAWLCEFHLETARTDGWAVKYRAPCAQACERCPPAPIAGLEAWRDSLRPNVVKLAARTWRLPTKAECPPPKNLKPWPKPKTRPPQRKAA